MHYVTELVVVIVWFFVIMVVVAAVDEVASSFAWWVLWATFVIALFHVYPPVILK